MMNEKQEELSTLTDELSKIRTSLFETSTQTAIAFVDINSNILQANHYFQELFNSHNNISSLSDLNVTEVYGLCDILEWFNFLISHNEQILPKVEVSVNNQLYYFTIMSTEISKQGKADSTREFVISLTDITNVVELHKNEIRISKELAYKQGIFDVTSEYIHNIGNIITGAQSLSDRIVKNLEPMQNFVKFFEMIKEQLNAMVAYVNLDQQDEFNKHLKKVEMSLNLIESSLSDTIKNVLQEDMKNLRKAISNIATTITYQQELYKNTKTDISEDVVMSDLLRELQSVISVNTNQLNININFICTNDIKIKTHYIHLFNGLLNLLKNAIDAVNMSYEEHLITQKNITLKVEKVDRNDGFLELDMFLDDNIVVEQDLVITVSDNGIGMTSDVLNNIFTQGFTTKEQGHGLGLHSFANYLLAHNHTITPYSEGRGKGSTFTVHLTMEQ